MRQSCSSRKLPGVGPGQPRDSRLAASTIRRCWRYWVALHREAHGAIAGLAIEPALGLPVALAGGAVFVMGALASMAARLAPSCPGVWPIAPGRAVARRLRIAEQLLRRRPALAARVLHDVEPDQPLPAAGLGWLLLNDRSRARGGRVGAGFDPASVGALEGAGQESEHFLSPSLRLGLQRRPT